MARVRNYYGGMYRKGNVSIWEAGLLVAYVIAAISVFGLATVNLAWITDFAPWIIVASALGVFALDKQKKTNRRMTGVEIAGLFLAIGLPIAALGVIPGLSVANYLDGATNSLIMLLVSCLGLIIAAKQD